MLNNQFEMFEEDRGRIGTIVEDERESISANPIMKIKEFLMKFNDEELSKDQIFDGKDYYIPKALFLLSRFPIFETIEQILRHLYINCQIGTEFPIESYLSYLTHYAPLPEIGSQITYSFPNKKQFVVESKLLNELPVVPINFFCDFFMDSFLSMPNLFELLNFFLCQLGSTVFISESANKIVISTEVLRSIIFPFDYDETYIPCLPSALINYLEAPFPVLVGLVVTKEEQLEEAYSIASNKTLFVDIDNNKLRVKFCDEILDIKDFRKQSEIIEQDIKVSFANKTLPLKSKLDKVTLGVETAVHQYKKGLKTDQDGGKLREKMVNNIRSCFLRYFVNIFRDYEKYIEEPQDLSIYDTDIREIFNEKQFIAHSKVSKSCDFYQDFFQTRLWVRFLEMK